MKCLKVLLVALVLPQMVLAQTVAPPVSAALNDLVNVATSAYLKGYVASVAPMNPQVDPAPVRGEVASEMASWNRIDSAVAIGSGASLVAGSVLFLMGVHQEKKWLRWVGGALVAIPTALLFIYGAQTGKMGKIEKLGQLDKAADVRSQLLATAFDLSVQQKYALRNHLLVAMQTGKFEVDAEVLKSSAVLSDDQVDIFVNHLKPAFVKSLQNTTGQSLVASSSDPVQFSRAIVKDLEAMKKSCGQDAECKAKVLKQLRRVESALYVVHRA